MTAVFWLRQKMDMPLDILPAPKALLVVLHWLFVGEISHLGVETPDESASHYGSEGLWCFITLLESLGFRVYRVLCFSRYV